MSIQPEPILDIVRGLSTVASFAIVVGQLEAIYENFFVSCCNRCRGTGIITCQHCHGTKTLRRRPAFLRVRDGGLVSNPADCYQCYYCGPSTTYDFNPFAEDDEDASGIIEDNLKAAMANRWPLPHAPGIKAGTQPCTMCGGNPRIRRLTPDFGRAFGLEEGWDWQISRRRGQRFIFSENRPAGHERLYLEYPAAPPRHFELPVPPPPSADGADDNKEKAAAGSSFSVDASAAYSVDDFVLPYASDDD